MNVTIQVIHNSFPFVPNIRDGDGHLIMPRRYENELKDGGLVMINVYPMMYVSLKLFSFRNLTFLQ